jgi:phage shock protein A
MVILDRIRRIISSNINNLIEKAEDPESLLKELIREMDENIINLRNESVRSVAGEKRLARRVESAKEKIRTWQENSERAVQDGDDELARKAIARKIQEEQRMSDLLEQHKRALESSESMKEQLRVLEDKVQDARRRKEILVARKRSAQTQKAMLSATQGFAKAARESSVLLSETESDIFGASSLEDDILRIETEAEAMRELTTQEPTLEEVFEKSKAEEEIERRLKELKDKFRTTN